MTPDQSPPAATGTSRAVPASSPPLPPCSRAHRPWTADVRMSGTPRTMQQDPDSSRAAAASRRPTSVRRGRGSGRNEGIPAWFDVAWRDSIVHLDLCRRACDVGYRRQSRRQRMRLGLTLALVLVPVIAAAQNRSEDEYTRYELLAPETSSFKIIYDVTAVTPGAKFYFNP